MFKSVMLLTLQAFTSITLCTERITTDSIINMSIKYIRPHPIVANVFPPSLKMLSFGHQTRLGIQCQTVARVDTETYAMNFIFMVPCIVTLY